MKFAMTLLTTLFVALSAPHAAAQGTSLLGRIQIQDGTWGRIAIPAPWSPALITGITAAANVRCMIGNVAIDGFGQDIAAQFRGGRPFGIDGTAWDYTVGDGWGLDAEGIWIFLNYNGRPFQRDVCPIDVYVSLGVR